MKLKGLYLVTPDYYGDKIFTMTEEALKNGVNILQYRDKTNNYDVKIYAGKKFKKLADDYSVPLIIDDDPVLMDIIDAEGIHVGRGDVPFDYLREKYGNKIIGVSTYGDVNKAIECQNLGATYVAFGSFFNTGTKKDATICDINILDNINDLKIPVFVIGGINLNNVDTLLKYNISGIAVVSSIYSSKNVGETVKSYIEKLREYKKI